MPLSHRATPKPAVLSALVLGCLAAQPLLAQTTDGPARTPATPAKPTTAKPQPQADKTDGMSTVEVVASRPTNKVDRDVYDLKNDISVSNASAADVLNNVPSVTVDQDGNVALRGNQNVQIMVNGKRDAQFQGQNRGDALNAFPAESIESIEVINVPGAEFGNEGGSGPIINLVLKRNRKAGSRANLSANKGSEGRYNAFLNGEHADGPYSISGNIGVRRDLRTTHRQSEREDLDPDTGKVLGGSSTASDIRVPRQSLTMNSTFTCNVGQHDQAGATVSYAKIKSSSDSVGNTYRYGPDQGAVADYMTRSHSDSPAENFGLGASYDHKSGEPGEELKFDLRYTGQTNNSESDVWYDYRLRPDRYVANNHRETGRRTRILDISTDYQRVVWDSGQLKAGAKVANSRGSNPTDYLAVNPVTGAYEPVSSRTSDFESDDRNADIYGILATRFASKVSVQGGMRGEYTELNVRQPLRAERDTYHYMNWLPSFYATYDLSETGMLQLRASRRISRPNERDLNPNLVYLSDFSARQGNPDLEPVNNDLYEVAYRDRFYTVESSFTLFKRVESPVVSNRSYPLLSDPNVIVTSPVNFGANDSVGVDLNFNMRHLFIDGLSANLGTTISNDKRLRLFNLSTTDAIEQTIHRESAKLRLAYQVGAESLQLMVNHNGPTLSGQGVNKAFTMTNLAWQHRVSPQMTLNFNVINVFNVGNMESDTANEVLRLHTLMTRQPRVFNFGLRYQWGGVTGDQRTRNGMRPGEFMGPRGEHGGFGGGREAGGGPGGGPGF